MKVDGFVQIRVCVLEHHVSRMRVLRLLQVRVCFLLHTAEVEVRRPLFLPAEEAEDLVGNELREPRNFFGFAPPDMVVPDTK